MQLKEKKYGLPVIILNTSEIWNKIIESKLLIPESFKNKLPADGMEFVLSMQQNEMFLLMFSNEEFNILFSLRNYDEISKNIYRIQKIAERNYVFRHHLETQLIDSKESSLANRFYIIQSLSALKKLNPIKISIDGLGRIIGSKESHL
jgi:CRISPR-associated endonuclease Csn1